MGNISLREAVKVFDVSRPTLLKALKNGTVSGVKDGKGRWELDPSELSRIYQSRRGEGDAILPDNGGKESLSFNEIEAGLKDRIKELESQLVAEKASREAAETIATERERHIDDLRKLLPRPVPAEPEKTEPEKTEPEKSMKKKKWWLW